MMLRFRTAWPERGSAFKSWEPWVIWAYGAGFDRETHRFVREADFRDVDETLLFADIIKLIRAKR